MDSKKLALLCRELADNRKAENIVVLDVSKLSSVTDYFVIVTGTSQPHLRAITDELNTRLRDEYDVRPLRTDGMIAGSWVIMDFFDVIVHIMHTDARKHYDLEGLWADAKEISPAKLKTVKAKAPVKTATKTAAKVAVKTAKPKKKKTPAKG
jgi:ribosome-associated protein